MQSWMFFSSPDQAGKNAAEMSVVMSLMPACAVSSEEWSAYVPESHERPQGPSLGFCCTAELCSLKKRVSDLPGFPILPFVSDLMIMPKCWADPESLSVKPCPDLCFRIQSPHQRHPVISVTAAIPDQPSAFRVCGSYCFFGPPYVLAPVPPLSL